MNERWQRELSKLRRAELPGDLWDRVQEGPRLEPDRPPRARRLVAAAAAFAVFAAGGILVWNAFRRAQPKLASLAGPAVVAVPPRGGVSPVFLPDGRPVWVVHHEKGGVSVVDGYSNHRAWGIEELLGWCAADRTFVEPAHGAAFDEAGRYVDGPAPSGITTYAFDVVATAADGEPGSIRITSPLREQPRGMPLQVPAIGGACWSADHEDYRGLRAHRIPPSAIWESPEALASAAPDGWAAVRGGLLIERDGLARLCARVIEDSCEDGAVARGIDGIGFVVNVQIPEGRSPYTPTMIWLAKVRDGLLDDLTLAVPRVTITGA